MKKTIFLYFVILTVSQVASAEEVWDMTLSPIMRQNSGQNDLTLRDIVDSQKTSPEFLKLYGSIFVPSSEGEGEGGAEPFHVMSALSRAGANLSQIMIRGVGEKQSAPQASETSANPEQAAVLDRVRQAVVDSVLEKNKDNSDLQASDVNVIWGRLPEKLPQKDSFSKVKAEREGDKQIRVLFQDEQDRTVALSEFEGDVTIKSPVVVSRHSLAPGSMVSEEDFREDRRVLGGLSQQNGILRKLSDMGKTGKSRWQLTQGMEANEVLYRDHLKESSEIQKGSIVTVCAKNNRFHIRALGKIKEVLDDGNTVSVENLDSKKIIMGRPLNANEVEVVF